MSKELTPLEALNLIAIGQCKGKRKQYIGIVIKSLKALEIIKEHRINIDILFDMKTYEHYCDYYGTPEEDFPLLQAITQEEYDLLKEALE